MILRFLTVPEILNSIQISTSFLAAAKQRSSWRSAYPRVRVDNVQQFVRLLSAFPLPKISQLIVTELGDLSSLASAEVLRSVYVHRLLLVNPCRTAALVYFVDSFKKVTYVRMLSTTSRGLGYDNRENLWNPFKLLQSKKCRALTVSGIVDTNAFPFHLARKLSFNRCTVDTSALCNVFTLRLTHCNIIYNDSVKQLRIKNYSGSTLPPQLLALCHNSIEVVNVTDNNRSAPFDPMTYQLPQLRHLYCRADTWRKLTPTIPKLESLQLISRLQQGDEEKINGHLGLQTLGLFNTSDGFVEKLSLPNLHNLSLWTNVALPVTFSWLANFPKLQHISVATSDLPLDLKHLVKFYQTAKSLKLRCPIADCKRFLQFACENKMIFEHLILENWRSRDKLFDWNGITLPSTQVLVLYGRSHQGRCQNPPPLCRVYLGNVDEEFTASFGAGRLVVVSTPR